jgi:hypothetical protein
MLQPATHNVPVDPEKSASRINEAVVDVHQPTSVLDRRGRSSYTATPEHPAKVASSDYGTSSGCELLRKHKVSTQDVENKQTQTSKSFSKHLTQI